MIDAARWKLLVRIAVFAALLLALFLAAEVTRLILLFHRLHPLAGWIMAGVLMLGALAVLLPLLARPRAHDPFIIKPAGAQASHHAKSVCCRQYAHSLWTLSRNGNLPEEQRRYARHAARSIEDVLRAHPLRDDLDRAIHHAETVAVPHVLQPLHQQATERLDAIVKAHLVGFSTGPFTALETVAFFARTLFFVVDLPSLYVPHLGLRARARMAYRMLLHTARFLPFSQALRAQLATHCPDGPPAGMDAVARALTAGWITSCVGVALMDRFTIGWSHNPAAAEARLIERQGEMINGLVERLAPLAPAAAAGAGESDAATARARWLAGVRAALVGAVQLSVEPRPVVPAASSAPPAHAAPKSASVWLASPASAGRLAPEGEASGRIRQVVRRRRRHHHNPILQSLYTFWQRWNYTLRGHRLLYDR